MLDQLFITALELPVQIGTLPHEQDIQQTVLLDITFAINIKNVAQSDCIEDTIDYAEAYSCLLDLSRSQHFFLIETFAERCVQTLFKQFCYKCSSITLTVRKPSALQKASCAGISIQRSSQAAYGTDTSIERLI